MIKRAVLRYPNADLRTIDLIEQHGLVRPGKLYLVSAIAKSPCHHRYRAHATRMPDLAETWRMAADQPQGAKFIRKYTAFTILVLDEWLLEKPDEHVQTMLLELMERHL